MERVELAENVGQLVGEERALLAPTGGTAQWPAVWGLRVLRVVLIVGLWAAVVEIGNYPPVILPSPVRVAQEFWVALARGQLLLHFYTTLVEVVLGLTLGVAFAVTLGYVLAHVRAIERFVAPYLVASQATPAVAIAPLLYIWFDAGLLTKVLVCALIVFFPVLVNMIVGLRTVEPDLRDLLRSLRASRWQTFVTLELPAALPVVFGGLKVGATLSVIGAIVGELQGGDNAGLWYFTNYGLTHYDTPQVFVGLLAMITLALALYGSVVLAESHLLRWKHH
jgi:NitT/TauT family transport system permease protein